MAITPFQLNEYTVQLVDIYATLEQEIFEEMARLLKAPPSYGRDDAIRWQVEKLAQTRQLNEFTISKLASISGQTREELLRLFQAVGADTIATVDEQVSKFNFDKLPLNTEFDTLLTGFVANVSSNIDNFVGLALIDRQGLDGAVTNTFKRLIETTVARVVVGEETVNQALTRAVTDARRVGLPTTFVNRAGRRMHVQEYLETSIRTTVNQTYNQVKEIRQLEYGIHLVVVDWYAGAREACQPIQGKVCSYRRPGEDTEGYPSIYEFGYGRPEGIRGINCRHSLIPFVKDVSTNNFKPPSIEEAKKYYAKQQKQRALEREVRKAKRELSLAETIGDPEGIKNAKELVRRRQNRVREFTKDNELPRRYDKERVI